MSLGINAHFQCQVELGLTALNRVFTIRINIWTQNGIQDFWWPGNSWRNSDRKHWWNFHNGRYDYVVEHGLSTGLIKNLRVETMIFKTILFTHQVFYFFMIWSIAFKSNSEVRLLCLIKRVSLENLIWNLSIKITIKPSLNLKQNQWWNTWFKNPSSHFP